jgi:hypothetical protein
MPLSMELPFADSNMAADVMGFTSHQQVHGEPPGRIAGCSHFSRQHYGDRSAPRHTPELAPKWASGSTWFGWVFTESADLSSCVLVAISPRARPTPRRRLPPLAPRRRARRRSPIGYIDANRLWHHAGYSGYWSSLTRSVPTNRALNTLRTPGLYGVPCWSAECLFESAGPQSQCAWYISPDPCSAPIRQLQPTRVFTYVASRQSTEHPTEIEANDIEPRATHG